MKIYYCFLLILLPAFAAFAQKDGPETVTGTITDVNNAVIKGVKVFAQRSDGKVFQAVTAEDGNYEISVPKGDYVLRYVGGRGWSDRTLLGYITSEDVKEKYQLNVKLEASSEGAMVSEFTCEPAEPGKAHAKCSYGSRLVKSDHATVIGTVFNTTGAVITGTTVTATHSDGRIFSTESSVIGEYKLNVPKGMYKLEFVRQHFARSVYGNLEVDGASVGVRNLDVILTAKANINTIFVPARSGKLIKQKEK